MNQAPTLSPELIKHSIALARALSAAARNWALYPPEHPAVGASVGRLSEALKVSTAGAAFAFGVTPKTLLVAGLPDVPDRGVERQQEQGNAQKRQKGVEIGNHDSVTVMRLRPSFLEI